MNEIKYGGYAKNKSRVGRFFLRFSFTAIALHWVFQSLLYIDNTERNFKITIDAIMIFGIGVILDGWFLWQPSWIAAFLIAHTLNFLFNGQIWGVLKHYGYVSNSFEQFIEYTSSFTKRAQREASIKCIMIYGSISRREWLPSSDLDVRIIRHSGSINGIRACWFLLRERSRALFAKFPIDAYVLDNEVLLQKLDPNDNPVCLYNSEDNINQISYLLDHPL